MGFGGRSRTHGELLGLTSFTAGSFASSDGGAFAHRAVAARFCENDGGSPSERERCCAAPLHNEDREARQSFALRQQASSSRRPEPESANHQRERVARDLERNNLDREKSRQDRANLLARARSARSACRLAQIEQEVQRTTRKRKKALKRIARGAVRERIGRRHTVAEVGGAAWWRDLEFGGRAKALRALKPACKGMEPSSRTRKALISPVRPSFSLIHRRFCFGLPILGLLSLSDRGCMAESELRRESEMLPRA